MATNLALPFSETTNGKPISTLSTTFPGTLIHTSGSANDFVWLWISLADYVDFTEAVYINLVKGTVADGYDTDSVIQITSGEKQLIESGVVITDSCELRFYINGDISTITNVAATATGFIHRRVD